MSDTVINKDIKEDKKEVDTLASLYEKGKESKAKIKHDKVYNFLVIFLACVITVCIGVIIGWLIAR